MLKAEVKMGLPELTEEELLALVAHAKDLGLALKAARKIANGLGTRVLEPAFGYN